MKEGETVEVDTEVTAPHASGSYDGWVRVVNKEDSSNYVDVQAKIIVENSRNLDLKFVELLMQKFPLFAELVQRFLV